MYHKEEEEAPLHPPVDKGEESDDDDGLSMEFPDVRPVRRFPRVCFRVMGRMLAWITIVGISGLAGAWLALHFVNIDQNCASHTTHWSPLLDDVKITYRPVHFDGRFMKENIFRQVGNAEVDAAWESLGVDARAGVISYEDGLKSGLDDSFVQRADEHGGGFLVNVEGMHHLHCLNLLRKSLWFNYDHYKEMKMHAFKNDGEILRLHVTHCLDTIRQVLMCNVDTGILGQVWVASENSDKPIAFPDFNTKHVCKNYDHVKDWAVKLQAPPVDEIPENYLKTPKKEHVIPQTP